ncbi:thrombomodulin [Austrofundulus limnaeus]|uniref:Thrombomodulin n=1 Tax=Austrofundulus limnaeus TaxID=52670 RepID=A0A2I4CAN5_AUSLI|nr:PREDICTED: thrombomodulin-like [Austrofundulus limnaeus]
MNTGARLLVLLVLLVLVGRLAGLKPNSGYCIGTGCVALFWQPADFRSAQKLCRDQRAQLVTVRSSVSSDVLSVLLGNFTGSFWIGLHRPAGCPNLAEVLFGYGWVTKDSESDLNNFGSSFNSSCSAPRCVSVSREDSFRWGQTPCAQLAAGFLCEFSFTDPCRTLPAAPDRSVHYMTPYGFGVEDLQLVPPGTTATRFPSGTKHICSSGQWLHAPWSCEIQDGGCEYKCAKTPGDGPVCFCPPGQTVNHANRVSCAAPGPGDPCAALRCQQLCREAEDGSARCACEHGLKLAEDASSCVDVDECADPRQCPGENFRCVNTQLGFACVCKVGYKKHRDRCVDVDECVSAPCEHTCVNTPGSYTCACYHGYRPADKAPNKCELFCGAEECPATCDPNDPRQCYCPDGFLSEERRTGVFCLDIDECSYNYCDQDCSNMPGSYLCSCSTGYKLVDLYRCVETDEEPEGSGTAPSPSAPSPSAPSPRAPTSVPDPGPTRRPSAVTPMGLVGIIVCVVLLIVLVVFGLHIGLSVRKKSSAAERKAAEDETPSLNKVTSNTSDTSDSRDNM